MDFGARAGLKPRLALVPGQQLPQLVSGFAATVDPGIDGLVADISKAAFGNGLRQQTSSLFFTPNGSTNDPFQPHEQKPILEFRILPRSR